jgi:hypothetical protein
MQVGCLQVGRMYTHYVVVCEYTSVLTSAVCKLGVCRVFASWEDVVVCEYTSELTSDVCKLRGCRMFASTKSDLTSAVCKLGGCR